MSKKLKMPKTKPSKKPYEIMFVGVDNAGKSTTIKQACGDESLLACHPTMGCDSRLFCHEMYHKSCKPVYQKFYLVDLGGHSRIRDIWSRYYTTSVGLVFVFDAADESRFPEVLTTFMAVIQNQDLTKTPILVIANKQDLDAKIKDEFDFFQTFKFKLHGKYKFVSGSAINPQDHQIRDGIHWLFEQCMINSELNVNAAKAVEQLKKDNKFAGLSVEQKFTLMDEIAAKNDEIDKNKKQLDTTSNCVLDSQLNVDTTLKTDIEDHNQDNRLTTPNIIGRSEINTPVDNKDRNPNKLDPLSLDTQKENSEGKQIKIKKLQPGEF